MKLFITILLFVLLLVTGVEAHKKPKKGKGKHGRVNGGLGLNRIFRDTYGGGSKENYGDWWDWGDDNLSSNSKSIDKSKGFSDEIKSLGSFEDWWGDFDLKPKKKSKGGHKKKFKHRHNSSKGSRKKKSSEKDSSSEESKSSEECTDAHETKQTTLKTTTKKTPTPTTAATQPSTKTTTKPPPTKTTTLPPTTTTTLPPTTTTTISPTTTTTKPTTTQAAVVTTSSEQDFTLDGGGSIITSACPASYSCRPQTNGCSTHQKEFTEYTCSRLSEICCGPMPFEV